MFVGRFLPTGMVLTQDLYFPALFSYQAVTFSLSKHRHKGSCHATALRTYKSLLNQVKKCLLSEDTIDQSSQWELSQSFLL